jgi:hypothetical protein
MVVTCKGTMTPDIDVEERKTENWCRLTRVVDTFLMVVTWKGTMTP